MTGLALTVAALVSALLAAGWAGLFALAEESPALSSSIGGPPTGAMDAEPIHRAFQVSRLALTVLAGVAASQAVGWWYRPTLSGLGVVVVSGGLLFMLADAVPRSVGLLAPDAAAAAATVARRTLLPFRPLIALVGVIERLLQRLLPRPAATGQPVLGPTQRDMLLGVFAMGDTSVADIMTPRIDVTAVDAEASVEEVLELIRHGGHLRIPVFDGTLDNVIGILHVRDLVPAAAGATDMPDRWQDRVRPAEFVPESKTLATQLRDFVRGSSHVAIVVDEFGGTAGLVTLGDIMEEIAGDIRDEVGDDEEPAVEQQGDNRFWVDGSVTLDQLSALLGDVFERDGVSTVGGLIYSELGRVPTPGEELRIGEFRVVVQKVVRRRVRRVYFERLEPRPEAQVATADPQ
ncbi:MAG: HlyC/CorC family transporter [Gemmatimonadetes bacterium]|nr:HlyC/CorC family transporter [Gemmatimonadota bacterium]